MHFPRSLPLNKVLLFLYWCFHSSCWCTFSGFKGQCTLQRSDLQTLLHKGSLALQVLVNINLTFSINSLRGWKTHISLGGCLTCQLQGKRESTSLLSALMPFLYKAILQTLLQQSCLFFKLSFNCLSLLLKCWSLPVLVVYFSGHATLLGTGQGTYVQRS